jgi:hypothetical protein
MKAERDGKVMKEDEELKTAGGAKLGNYSDRVLA